MMAEMVRGGLGNIVAAMLVLVWTALGEPVLKNETQTVNAWAPIILERLSSAPQLCSHNNPNPSFTLVAKC